MLEIPWLHLSCRHWAATSLLSTLCNTVSIPQSFLLRPWREIVPADTKVGNHTGYKQWKGTKGSAEEIQDLYTGLKQSYLTDFDVLLTGYAPSAETVDAVGSIARDLKLKGSMKAGSFFWSKSMVLGQANKDNS